MKHRSTYQDADSIAKLDALVRGGHGLTNTEARWILDQHAALTVDFQGLRAALAEDGTIHLMKRHEVEKERDEARAALARVEIWARDADAGRWFDSDYREAQQHALDALAGEQAT